MPVPVLEPAAIALPSAQVWLLGIRLLLSPALIALATGIARRWGPDAGGWFTGLPLTSGPVALVLVLEHGAGFGRAACVGFLLAVIPLTAYALVYAWTAHYDRWLASASVACTVYLLGAWLLRTVTLPLGAAFVAAAGATGARVALPRGARGRKPAPRSRWDIPLRMALSVLMVELISRVAIDVGPRLSGLLAPFPVATTIMTTCTHRLEGAAAAQQFARGLIRGLLAYSVFFGLLGAVLRPWGAAYAFVFATVGALTTSLGVGDNRRRMRALASGVIARSR